MTNFQNLDKTPNPPTHPAPAHRFISLVNSDDSNSIWCIDGNEMKKVIAMCFFLLVSTESLE